MWLDTPDYRSWDRNPADFYASRRFCRTATRKSCVSEGILTHMHHFCFVNEYTLNDYRELSSLEEPRITQVATVNSFARELNPTPCLAGRLVGSIYIIIHKQTVSLYPNSSVRLDTRVSRSWDRNPAGFYAKISKQCLVLNNHVCNLTKFTIYLSHTHPHAYTYAHIHTYKRHSLEHARTHTHTLDRLQSISIYEFPAV